MNNNRLNNKKKGLSGLTAAACGLLLLCGCSDFLEPKPLSFYDPTTTFTTEAGLQATMAAADKQLRDIWINGESNALALEYRLSELAANGKTDESNPFCDINGTLTPTNMRDQTGWFWNDVYYSGIKFPNTILTYINGVEGLEEATKNAYIGRAYFHRAIRYLNLVFQFKDIPLLTKVISVPKQNYATTDRKAILDMITKDMEFAVEWVPEQKDMDLVGQVNKGACRQLLIKCYLATGQWEKAKEQADILIDKSGYELMKEPFGTFVESGEPETWKITRNVIWDLHRAENKLTSANKEVIYGIVSRGSGESLNEFHTMRAFGPFWTDAKIKGPDGKPGATNFARNNAKYNKKYDFVRVIGRGIANIRPTYFATHTLWQVNGMDDKGDLRHSAKVGNWFPMDSLKYNDPASAYYGKTYAEVRPDCSQDTIRSWFDFPLYKIYLKDVVAEGKPQENNFKGATKGSIADWYIYRLAETYLLRAEAKFYMGDATGAADDVNEVRKRAHCEQHYTTVTIGDIMNERARELYLEELRQVELSRVSYCLALSGKPDEWGNVYDVNTYDRQEGTDANGGSYWYQRIVHYSGLYNTGKPINANGRVFNYEIGKHNLYWPVPNEDIKKNTGRQMRQNFGYDGYDPNITMWENWEDAVADEDKTE